MGLLWLYFGILLVMWLVILYLTRDKKNKKRKKSVIENFKKRRQKLEKK